MKEKPIEFIQDRDTRELMQHIFQNAQGNILTLSAAPTATAPLLKTNEWGKYSTSFYYRLGQTIFVFASSSQITIT